MRDLLRNDQTRWAAIIVAGVTLILSVGLLLRGCSDEPTLGEVTDAVNAVVDCDRELRIREVRDFTEIRCNQRPLVIYRPGEDPVNVGLGDEEFERVEARLGAG